MKNAQFKVRDKRNRGWFYLDNAYLDGYAKVFGAIGSAIYFSLCRHANMEQKCYPSEALIAKEFGITARTVRTYLKLLEKARLIYVDRKSREGNGKWRCNVYWLLDKSEWMKPEEIVSYGRGRKGKTEREENLHASDGNVVPLKNTNEKDTHTNKTNVAEQRHFSAVDYLMPRFSAVNINWELLMKNNTEKKALARFINRFGVEHTESIIAMLPTLLQNKYAPVITSPYELEKKMPKLMAFWAKEKAPSGRGRKIIQ